LKDTPKPFVSKLHKYLTYSNNFHLKCNKHETLNY